MQWLLLVIWFFLVVVISVTPLFAHSWYEQSCCSGRDCGPVDVEAVTVNSEGNYVVTIPQGTHPMAMDHDVVVVFPHEKVRASQDGDWHACFAPFRGPDGLGMEQYIVYCLYAPMTF